MPSSSVEKVEHKLPFEPPLLEDLDRKLDDFEVIEEFDSGGCGLVYRGRQVSLDRPVAIKIVKSDLDGDRPARLRREAKALAQLSHPNIVAAYDFGEADLGEGQHFLFFAMDFVDGEDLSRILDQKFSPERTVNIVCQICAALEYAHSKGVIHRDIKPSNILIESNGDADLIKVADFGLAKVMEGIDDTFLTQSGTMVGTENYVAPEVMDGEKSDHRADIYAVGVITYQLLTGHLPKGRFDSTTKVIPNCRPELDKVIDRALAQNPNERYQHISDFARDLMDACGERESVKWRYLMIMAIVMILGGSFGYGIYHWVFPEEQSPQKPPMPLQPRPILFADVLNVPDSHWAAETSTWEPGTIGQNSMEMTFSWIPGGEFQIGSPVSEEGSNQDFEFLTDVKLTRGFWMGQFEVTQVLFNDVMGYNPSEFQGDPNLPVENLTFSEAVEFCEKLTELERKAGVIGEGMRYKLPTEAQWERGCRAGGKIGESHHGDLDEVAWYGRTRTTRVGGRKPNAWNLYDMHGNVREFCDGWFNRRQHVGGVDPIETENIDNMHASRGGSYNDGPRTCRSAFRGGNYDDNKAKDMGFRIVLVKE